VRLIPSPMRDGHASRAGPYVTLLSSALYRIDTVLRGASAAQADAHKLLCGCGLALSDRNQVLLASRNVLHSSGKPIPGISKTFLSMHFSSMRAGGEQRQIPTVHVLSQPVTMFALIWISCPALDSQFPVWRSSAGGRTSVRDGWRGSLLPCSGRYATAGLNRQLGFSETMARACPPAVPRPVFLAE